ncbi:MAG: dipeptidase PepV [Firmicutes bacterium]|nr:dipeptidase PepV [Bacillota bacterium]
MDFMKYAQEHKEEIIKSTQELLQIPSIEGTPQPGMPLGEDVNKALEYVLDLSGKLGFRTKNLDGYVGWAEYGSGDEMLAILCHLDVVPAGEGWTKPAFEGVVEDGKIYGRGATDNKGPTISALYALKAVMDAKIPLQRRVRIIFGTNEESGWRCMQHYCKHDEMPTMAFVPDATYPVVNVEKGIVHVRLLSSGKPSAAGDGRVLKVLELQGGHRPNMVPAQCTCRLSGDESALEQAAEIAKTLTQDPYPQIEASLDSGVLTLTVTGLAGHASTPQSGVNAAAYMLQVLDKITEAGYALDSTAVTQLVRLVSAHIGLETNGQSMGIGFSDSVSGALTLNIGVLNYQDEQAYIDIDIRYPVTKQQAEIVDPIKAAAAKFGVVVEVGHSQRSLHVPEDSFLVQQLLRVYEKYTGQQGKPLAIGGGTYARALDVAVAFGPVFPEDQRNIHREDEYATIDELLRNTAIFADAICLLAGE